mgnify:CR=1 FL=1
MTQQHPLIKLVNSTSLVSQILVGLVFGILLAMFMPEWAKAAGLLGSLFVGALRGAALWRMTLDGERVTGREALYEGELGRVRDVRQGPDGLLYVLTDAADDGRVIRLTPSGS